MALKDIKLTSSQSSGPQTARRVLSGLHAKNETPWLLGSRDLLIFNVRVSGSKSHIITVLSLEPVASLPWIRNNVFDRKNILKNKACIGERLKYIYDLYRRFYGLWLKIWDNDRIRLWKLIFKLYGYVFLSQANPVCVTS